MSPLLRGTDLRQKALLLLVSVVPAHAALAQQYYELDVGRPTRIADAVPVARYDLDLQLAALRFERYGDGTERWRYDPRLEYGIAPFTEIGLRAPLLIVNPNRDSANAVRGMGGLAVGVHHAFGLETGNVPALGVAGEWVLPVGNLAARVGSFTINAFATKTLAVGRLHLNVGLGSWSIRPGPTISCTEIQLPGAPPPPGCSGGPFIPDTPCDRAPSSSSVLRSCAIPKPVTVGGPVDSAQASTGRHALIAFGADHAFAVHSLLITADVVGERFDGLYAQTDWTGEMGVREQVSPRAVFDAGISRHFAGQVQWTAITLGLSFHTPMQWRL